MADIVNPQITDAVARTGASPFDDVIADAPAMALANLYQANAQALGNAAQNAVTAQQAANTVLQAAISQGVALLLNQS